MDYILNIERILNVIHKEIVGVRKKNINYLSQIQEIMKYVIHHEKLRK
jgi:hypothetical protein